MPLLIVIGILAVNGVICVYENGNQAEDGTSGENHNMMVEMTGKSQKECKKILRNYKGNWLQR